MADVILVLNAGSSSLKFRAFDATGKAPALVLRGQIEGLYTAPSFTVADAKGAKITEKKWESCRGLGFSFGYNQAEGPEHVLAPDKLITLFVDIVSKNGNLLLNIGPRADGTISEIQTDRLRELGRWLAINGEGIFDTTPWVRASASDPSAPQVRFTRKGDSTYAFLLEAPSSGKLVIPGVIAAENSKVRVLGSDVDARWKQNGRNLELDAPSQLKTQYAVGVRVSPQPWQVVKS